LAARFFIAAGGLGRGTALLGGGARSDQSLNAHK
jgi:hypothetical protein